MGEKGTLPVTHTLKKIYEWVRFSRAAPSVNNILGQRSRSAWSLGRALRLGLLMFYQKKGQSNNMFSLFSLSMYTINLTDTSARFFPQAANRNKESVTAYTLRKKGPQKDILEG